MLRYAGFWRGIVFHLLLGPMIVLIWIASGTPVWTVAAALPVLVVTAFVYPWYRGRYECVGGAS